MPQPEANPSSTIVDISVHDELMPRADAAVQGPASRRSEATQTFTDAVATVFQTFNETQEPYRQKREAELAADYRAYKHISIEGYRNGDNLEEEGRLHINLAHHILLWESYDDYEGGAKLTLDRIELPQCTSFLSLLHWNYTDSP